MDTAISVPGKLILMGEHAVVYGRPALIAAVGMRLHAAFAPEPSGGVRFRLPQIRVDEKVDWDAVREYALSARRRWEQFHQDPAQGFDTVTGEDPAHLIKVALGEAALWCGEGPFPPVRLELESDIPIGSGFGSSAAAAVGIIAGWLHHLGREVDFDTLDELALEVERRQHGTPSGVDNMTVLRGGLLWARRNKGEGDGVRLQRLPVSRQRLAHFRVFHTGAPAESTGEVVAAVRALRDEDPDAFRLTLDRMEFATRQLRHELAAPSAAVDAVIQSVRTYQQCLEEIGVVPEPVCEVVRQVEAHGGAAKVSGAGSLDGPGAGCLLVAHEEPDKIDGWPFLDGYLKHPVSIGVEGLREEPAA